MGLYRSEEMRLYQLTVPKDENWNVMNEFGDLGLAHFIDLNKDDSPYNLPSIEQVKQTERAEKKLDYLLGQCTKHYIKVTQPENINGFLH